MDKVKLEFKAPENKIIEYNGISFEITPFFTIEKQVFLFNRYVEEYFGGVTTNVVEGSEYAYLNAEYNLFNYILQINTNIDMTDFDGNLYVDPAFIEKVTSQIINYGDFRNKLNFIVNERKQEIMINNSLGKVVSDLVAKGYDILNKFSDIKPEDIEKMQKTGLELAKKLEESSILKDSITPPVVEETPVKKTRKQPNNVGKT